MDNVTMRFFGPMRELVEHDELQLEIPASATGETVFDLVRTRYPEIERWRATVRLAVNLEYVSFDHEIRPGDEICFIPPVSGG